MKIADNLLKGSFINRENRFKASVEIDGRQAFAHVPNSGRMQELLVKGAEVALVAAASDKRITEFDLVQVLYRDIWVSTDSRMPNKLIADAFQKQLIPEFQSYETIKMEPAYGSGRFDISLNGSGGECLIECKSVNLVEKGVALFPDAPTLRGVRHLKEMSEFVQSGGRGMVFFVIQRQDAVEFKPFEARDPDFARACRQAQNAGVELVAYRSKTDFGSILLDEKIEVIL